MREESEVRELVLAGDLLLLGEGGGDTCQEIRQPPGAASERKDSGTSDPYWEALAPATTCVAIQKRFYKAEFTTQPCPPGSAGLQVKESYVQLLRF
jgi:hypothetical protein